MGDINGLHFFPRISDNTNTFIEKLDVLLTWCVTPLQYGDHRPFAAVALISNWRNRQHERAARRHLVSPDDFLQDQLFDWLDTSETTGKPDNSRSVALLFGRLVNRQLFSYSNYIQRLIARGEAGLSFTEVSPHLPVPSTLITSFQGGNESRHRRFLRWIPLFKSSPPSTSQRKATLYGIRVREIPEEANERVIRREIRAALPYLFRGPGLSGTGSPGSSLIEDTGTAAAFTSIPIACPTLVSSPCFEQVRTLGHWLLSLLQKYIIR